MVFDLCTSLVSILLLFISTKLFISKLKHGFSSPNRLPPGPFPLPVVGNLFSLNTKPHHSFAKLARIYGPVFSLRLGYVTTIVVTSTSAAKEVLQKYDALFANRFVPDAMTLLHHARTQSSRWRSLRKIYVTNLFSTSRMDATSDLRNKKVQELMCYVRECSEAGKSISVGQAGFSTVLNVLSYAFFSKDVADPRSSGAQEFKDLICEMMVESGKPNIADFYPMLKGIDPQGLKRKARTRGVKFFKFFDDLVEERLSLRKSTDYIDNNDVLDVLLNICERKTEELEPSGIRHLLAVRSICCRNRHDLNDTGMGHGRATTQKELDEVIGIGNAVEERHTAELTYLSAVVKETLRLHPSVAFLVPRQVHEEVKLLGFVVPKGAQVFINVWAMGRDPELWKNSHTFEPERFLESHIDYKGRDFELIPFGAGRRICPGLPLAHRMLHLILASLIHSFDWELPDGITSETIDMDDKFGFTFGMARPLNAKPVPRSR
ncbi:Geraniol 8-hydroxylase-like protein [Drosera capensis]